MIFSSYPYLIFLALTVSIFIFLEARLPGLRRTFLLLISLVFYAWWRVDFLALLLTSTFVNYAIGTMLTRRFRDGRTVHWLLILGLVFNLGLIAWFKYAGLFAQTANTLFAADLPIPSLFLPLAISFFTFEQISYLVDAAAGKAPHYSLLDYSLFVAFFPHLIAGPIIRHNDLIPQFGTRRDSNTRADDIAVGATLFTIGLAKKTLIADNIAPFSDAVFAAANHGAAIGTADAWMGTLFFAFQIYFDFSAYSDMALGSACMFGLRLPINFNSPYKATSIIEFWRLWHISLSTFLRDYLYIPLGGNRHGSVRRYANLLITMLLGGLWHGANWTFVLWGGLHGVYLIVNHAWRHVTRRAGLNVPKRFRPLTRALSVAVSFLATLFAWTVFRSQSFDSALAMMAGLAGAGGDSHILSFGPLAWAGFVAMFAIVWGAPNSMEITWRLRPALESYYRDAGVRDIGRWAWIPGTRSAIAFGLLFVVSVMALSNLSPFIYFQF
ncbi:MAG: hypothetical protein BGO00_13595 [Alphaproteobacteria bacterium 62-8]|nr:MAG: hypothetical protein BGO00_13595 [Alphaproteobacteria bacterium 62-8]